MVRLARFERMVETILANNTLCFTPKSLKIFTKSIELIGFFENSIIFAQNFLLWTFKLV